MKLYTAKPNGQRVYTAKDLQTVQDEILLAMESQYADYGDFVFNGCEVTGAPGNYAISSGLVYIAGKIRQFEAVTGIAALPKYIVSSLVEEVPRQFKLGGTYNVIDNHKAVLSDTVAANYVEVSTDGVLSTYKGVINGLITQSAVYALVQNLFVKNDGLILKTKEIPLGDWDMDATNNSGLIPHGIGDHHKIRTVLVSIRGDSEFNPVTFISSSDPSSEGYIEFASQEFIRVWRKTGGMYDSVLYNQTSYNRGYITISYVE